MTNSTYWLIASVALLALEAFGMPGIGFMFAGAAALITAGAIALGVIAEDALVLQWALFFGASVLSAVLLWKRLKNWRMRPDVPEYNNMVGTEAVVKGMLVGTQEGQVHWSGTLMRAKLADANAATLADGTVVTIVRVDGNLVFVEAK